jgi:hypothetical protein
LDNVLSQDMVHIDDVPFLGDSYVVLGILSSCVACGLSYFTWTIPPFLSFLYLMVGLDKRVMKVCVDIMGLGSWEYF